MIGKQSGSRVSMYRTGMAADTHLVLQLDLHPLGFKVDIPNVGFHALQQSQILTRDIDWLSPPCRSGCAQQRIPTLTQASVPSVLVINALKVGLAWCSHLNRWS